MKNFVKSIVTLGLLAVLTAVSGQKVYTEPSRHATCPVIHAMVADSDIGDGTSPAKKG